MSDEAPITAAATPAAPNAVVANATQALAIKELGDSIAAIRTQVKTLWIALAVVVVLTAALAVVSVGPRFGIGTMGGTRPNWQRAGAGTTGAATTGGGVSTDGGDQVIEIQP